MEGVCNKAMIRWEIINDEMSLGTYIKYVGGRLKGFTNSSKKKFIAQKNIDLNISWSSNFFWKIFHGLSHQFLFEAYL